MVCHSPAAQQPEVAKVVAPLNFGDANKHEISRVKAHDEPVVVALSDGSRAVFLPRSEAVLRGPVGDLRQVVSLSRGGASFQVEKGRRQFRVETPLGDVTVLGTEFEVRLQDIYPTEGDDEMLIRSFVTLAVLVTAGQVEVEVNGRRHLLSAGESHVFGQDRERARPDGAENKRRADFHGTLIGYDEKAGTLAVWHGGERGGGNAERTTFVVAKDVKVIIDNDKPGKISDLPEETPLDLVLNEDKTTILAIRAEGRAYHVERLQAVDADKNTITVSLGAARTNVEGVKKLENKESVHQVAADAKITVDGQPAKLADLKLTSGTTVKLSLDQKSVVGISQGGGRDRADPNAKLERRIIQSIDLRNNTVQFRAEGREIIFAIAADVIVSIRGRPAKLADIQPESAATIVMSADHKSVAVIAVGKNRGIGIGVREGDRRPDGDKPREEERNPDGEKKRDGERRPDSDKPRDGERNPGGEKKRDGERRLDGDKPRDGERRPDTNPKRDGERKPDAEPRRDGDERKPDTDPKPNGGERKRD